MVWIAEQVPNRVTRYDWRVLPWLGAVVLVAFWALAPTGGFDATNYHALDMSDPYRARWHEAGSYVYSPAFAQVLYPFTLLPADVFEKLLLGVNLTSLAWLLGPVWGALSLLLLPVQSELLTGQIHLVIAALLVLSLRYPAVWALTLLTKVTPGVALLWFAARWEWSKLGIALGVTAAIVVVSALVWPSVWVEWFGLIRESPGKRAMFLLVDYPFMARLAVCAVLVVLAARRDRPAALPFIVLLSLPAVWFTALTLLAAVPRLTRSDSR